MTLASTKDRTLEKLEYGGTGVNLRDFLKLNKRILQDFHANNDSFLIKAGTSNSHATNTVLLQLVQFYNGNFILHAAFQVIYGIDRNQLQPFPFISHLLSANISVSLQWAPGHSDLPGNGKANDLAQGGASLPCSAPQSLSYLASSFRHSLHSS